MACLSAANPLKQNLEPVSAVYDPMYQVLVPSSRNIMLPSAFVFSQFAETSGFDYYTEDYQAALQLGPLAYALWNEGAEKRNIYSLSIPAIGQDQLGYTYSSAGEGLHALSLQGRPYRWFSYGLSWSDIGVDDFIQLGFSFRPGTQKLTLSLQPEWDELRAYPTDYSLFAAARFNKLWLKGKVDTEGWSAGVSLDFDSIGLGSDFIEAGDENKAYRRDFFRYNIGSVNRLNEGERQPLLNRKHFIPLYLAGSIKDFEAGFVNGSYVPSLYLIDDILERVIASDDIDGLYVILDNYSSGLATTAEIREKLAAVKKAGKKIYFYSDSYNQLEYYLASLGDQINMGRMGSVDIKGLNFKSLYFGDLLTRFGIKFDVIRAGKYKNLFANYTQSEMSDSEEEVNRRLLMQLEEQLFPPALESRKLEGIYKEWLENGPYDGGEALEKGLVDRLVYPSDLDELYRKDNLVFKSIGSLFSEDKFEWRGTLDPSIAIIHIEGNMIDGYSGVNPLNGSKFVGSDTISMALRDVLRNRHLKAILLRVNSGGGSVVSADKIWRDLMNIRQMRPDLPIVTSFGNIAASGGYYVSTAGSTIFSQEETLTGSIGVIFGKPNASGLLERFEVNYDGLKSAENSDINNLYEDYSPKQREKLQKQIDNTYEAFLDVVDKGRENLNSNEVALLAQGRVWTGEDALSNGLADIDGGLAEAVRYTRELVELDPTIGGVRTYTTTSDGRSSIFLYSFNSLAKSLKHQRLGFENRQFSDLQSMNNKDIVRLDVLEENFQVKKNIEYLKTLYSQATEGKMYFMWTPPTIQ